MKCPQCGKSIKPDTRQCKHCGTRLVRKSDKIARKMTLNSHFTMVCGGILIFLAVLLAIYGDKGIFWEAFLAGLGMMLIVIARIMR